MDVISVRAENTAEWVYIGTDITSTVLFLPYPSLPPSLPPLLATSSPFLLPLPSLPVTAAEASSAAAAGRELRHWQSDRTAALLPPLQPSPLLLSPLRMSINRGRVE